jgi:plasmid maintenance system antidote protein VapI
MALRLGRVFGTSEQYWLNLESLYQAKKARAKINIEAITPLQMAG